MQKLHIILQKHAFCKEKERDKNKNKTKKQRDRLKNCLLFIVKFCCGDDWSAASRQLCRNVQNFQIPDISSWWNVFQSVFWGLWKSRQMIISIIIFNSTLPCDVLIRVSEVAFLNTLDKSIKLHPIVLFEGTDCRENLVCTFGKLTPQIRKL